MSKINVLPAEQIAVADGLQCSAAVECSPACSMRYPVLSAVEQLLISQRNNDAFPNNKGKSQAALFAGIFPLIYERGVPHAAFEKLPFLRTGFGTRKILRKTTVITWTSFILSYKGNCG